ncbi:DUF7064 domain-containing protein [Microbacterium aurum]
MTLDMQPTDAPSGLVTPDMPERYFDRFMFNLHPVDGSVPWIIVGAGLYPRRDVVDGFAVVVEGAEQRNLQFSSLLSYSAPDHVGPLSWEVVKPNDHWRVRLDDPATGVLLEFDWHQRAPAWQGDVVVENTGSTATRFTHLFQSGLVQGRFVLDGETTVIEDWYSQRDRSVGVRTMAGGQGLHVWLQAQFPDCSVGFLLVESRDGTRLQLEGAIMHTDGRIDPIVAVTHDFEFDEGLDLRGGRVVVITAGGESTEIDVDASLRGGYMAGAGYGGHHGVDHGAQWAMRDRYPLDGTVSPRSLDTPLTDRLAQFTRNGVAGSGIVEFAHSRSSSYAYRPTI